MIKNALEVTNDKVEILRLTEQLNSIISEVERLKSDASAKDQTIVNLKSQLATTQSQMSRQQVKSTDLSKQLPTEEQANKDKTIADLEESLRVIKQDVKDKEVRLQEQQADLQEKEERLHYQEQQVRDQEELLLLQQTFKDELEERSNTIKSLQSDLEYLVVQSSQKDDKIDLLESAVSAVQAAHREKELEIAELAQEHELDIQEKDQLAIELQVRLEQAELHYQEQQVRDQEEFLLLQQTFKDELEESSNTIKSLQSDLEYLVAQSSQKDDKIDLLECIVSEAEMMHREKELEIAELAQEHELDIQEKDQLTMQLQTSLEQAELQHKEQSVQIDRLLHHSRDAQKLKGEVYTSAQILEASRMKPSEQEKTIQDSLQELPVAAMTFKNGQDLAHLLFQDSDDLMEVDSATMTSRDSQSPVTDLGSISPPRAIDETSHYELVGNSSVPLISLSEIKLVETLGDDTDNETDFS